MSTPHDRARGKVALSTSSVYPESADAAFEIAGSVGYDAIEVMVSLDPLTQDVESIRQLQDRHGIAVCAVHAPCLLITQRVWSTDPWEKLQRSAEMAAGVGADVVVVHPPFRWQRQYARSFERGIAALEERTGLAFAVENMYPWRASAKREMQVYLPHYDPTGQGYASTTLDVSHAATSRADSLEMAKGLGDRLRHVHLSDGTGSAKDEHLIPGRGGQPVAGLLEHLAESAFGGHIVLEVNTRRAADRDEREIELMEGLAFTRLHYERARA